jgi:hypothetical protein
MECAQGIGNSYAEVTVKSGTPKVAYKDEEQQTPLVLDAQRPCGRTCSTA